MDNRQKIYIITTTSVCSHRATRSDSACSSLTTHRHCDVPTESSTDFFNGKDGKLSATSDNIHFTRHIQGTDAIRTATTTLQNCTFKGFRMRSKFRIFRRHQNQSSEATQVTSALQVLPTEVHSYSDDRKVYHIHGTQRHTAKFRPRSLTSHFLQIGCNIMVHPRPTKFSDWFKKGCGRGGGCI